ncbi:hypothetical protein RJ55_07932 [Drechmeria coniospora]|nr:hypothetical protein RJ55_07932 [Drechmeria coniospora]
MDNGNFIRSSDALSLALSDNRELTISRGHLVLHDPAAEKSQRSSSSCIAITTDASGKKLIPLYNILWAEVLGSQLYVDYAAQSSKTTIKLEKWVYDTDATTKTCHGPTANEFVSALNSRAYADAQAKKRALVLINPNAGPGGALRKWDRDVKPLFDAARMHMDIVVLSRGGEAAELAENINIESPTP